MINGLIGLLEKRVGIPLAYLRYIASVSIRLFFRFLKIFSFGNCGKAASKEALHTAALVATLHEDCGECVQIGINLAKRDGLAPSLLHSILNGKPEELSPQLQNVFEFARASLSAEGPSEELLERMKKNFGDEALIEIAMVLAAARVFPQVKRALGYSISCSVRGPTV